MMMALALFAKLQGMVLLILSRRYLASSDERGMHASLRTVHVGTNLSKPLT